MTRDEECSAECTFRLLKEYQGIPNPDSEGRTKPTIEELTDFVKACNLYGAQHGPYTFRDVVELYPEFEEIANWCTAHWIVVKVLLSLDDIEVKRYPEITITPTFLRKKE